jgi:hypothetical protein
MQIREERDELDHDHDPDPEYKSRAVYVSLSLSESKDLVRIKRGGCYLLSFIICLTPSRSGLNILMAFLIVDFCRHYHYHEKM